MENKKKVSEEFKKRSMEIMLSDDFIIPKDIFDKIEPLPMNSTDDGSWTENPLYKIKK